MSSSTLYKSGRTLHQKGDLSGAAELYRLAVAADPSNADALHMLGVAALQLSLPEAAVETIKKALIHRPQFPEAWGNLGTALKILGRTDESEIALNRAISEGPNIAPLHFNLGNFLAAEHRLEESEDSYREAIRLQPTYSEANSGLGTVLRNREDLIGATAAFETAVRQNPNFAEARYNLGNAYRDLGRLTDAEAQIRAAITARPNYSKAYNTLGTILSEMCRSEEALNAFATSMEYDPSYVPASSNWLGTQQYVAGVSEQSLAKTHKLWADRHTKGITIKSSHTNTRDIKRPVVIGFLSPDLGIHPVGLLSVRLFENLNHTQIQPVVFSTRRSNQEDTISYRIAAVTDWRHASRLSDESLIKEIENAQVDILFDMSGHTADHRLQVFAHKPAPIQISWLGYVGSTGLQAMDYVMADNVQAPPGTEQHYTENIIRLPSTYTCFDPPDDAPEVGALPAKKRDHFTYGCLNNPAKLNDKVLKSFAAILARVPNSRMVLRYKGLEDITVKKHLLGMFEANGIDSARIDILGYAERTEFLDTYNKIDIALDTFPYSGGLTTCEALWMGCPVVTFPGVTFAGRHSTSYMTHVGLPNFIAKNRLGYEDLAVAKADDLKSLAAIRKRLRRKFNDSCVCDGPQFARNFTKAMQNVWRNYCE
ncbi:MAG: hypothetical protein CMG46_11750 [Candidatus Marinimicrobia bacterium]|nr:hypothetical protein [Candidatus Neomarinimicrobiota bacterium]